MRRALAPSRLTADTGRCGLGGLSVARRRTGLALTLLALPALTALLVSVRGALGLESVLLVYLLAVVAIAVVGGLVDALLAAFTSFLLANWFLTPPYYTFEVEGRDRVIELAVFVVVGVLVSVSVELGARDRASAERSRMEAGLLAHLASSEIGATSPEGVLQRIQAVFELSGVELVSEHAGDRLAHVGECSGAVRFEVATASGLVLRGYGRPHIGGDNRLLRTLAESAARSWEEQRLAAEAARAEQLAETDRIRAALLAAVSHDLRTPLAATKAAVSSLRQEDVTWTPDEAASFLATIEQATDRLSALIADLLAMSRIQAGAVSVRVEPLRLDQVVAQAVLDVGASRVVVAVPEDLPDVVADAALLERVVANLVDNATRYSPVEERVEVSAGTSESGVALDVVDHGPGVPEEEWERMFRPFQRLGDREPRNGVGLGLAIARGFADAMDVGLTPSRTPGGGLSMRLTIPAVSR